MTGPVSLHCGICGQLVTFDGNNDPEDFICALCSPHPDHTHECRRCHESVECGYRSDDCELVGAFEGYCDTCDTILATA